MTRTTERHTKECTREYLRYLARLIGVEGSQYTEVKEGHLTGIIEKVNKAYQEIAESLSTSTIIEEILSEAWSPSTRARNKAGRIAVIRVKAEVEYRAQPGAGQAAPIDGWLPAIHPIFHIPYLPGSSIKGVIRAAYRSLLEEANPDLDPRDVERCLDAIFGSSEGPLAELGGITVLDSYPEPGTSNVLVKDIMTPHYYKGGKPVKSEEKAQPTPIQGASIAEGTQFTIVILVDQGLIEERLSTIKETCLPDGVDTNNRAPEVINLIWRATYHALKNMGIGSKTLKGYGTLKISKAEYKV